MQTERKPENDMLQVTMLQVTKKNTRELTLQGNILYQLTLTKVQPSRTAPSFQNVDPPNPNQHDPQYECRPRLFSCSTQLNIEFFLLKTVIMPKLVGILTFMSRENSILG